jgi:hypothetical protein
MVPQIARGATLGVQSPSSGRAPDLQKDPATSWRHVMSSSMSSTSGTTTRAGNPS